MKMTKVRIDHLDGVALDWAVAKAIGGNPWVTPFGGVGLDSECWALAPFRPSTDWAHGGPLIETDKVHIEPISSKWWWAGFEREFGDLQPYWAGKTALIAACRALVGRFLQSDTVEVPAALINGGSK